MKKVIELRVATANKLASVIGIEAADSWLDIRKRTGISIREKARDKGNQIKEQFLDLWKDADLGMPEVEDARMKLAGMNGS